MAQLSSCYLFTIHLAAVPWLHHIPCRVAEQMLYLSRGSPVTIQGMVVALCGISKIPTSPKYIFRRKFETSKLLVNQCFDCSVVTITNSSSCMLEIIMLHFLLFAWINSVLHLVLINSVFHLVSVFLFILSSKLFLKNFILVSLRHLFDFFPSR